MFELFPRLKERHAQVAGSLSGGEQQMLAIGRALMGNPRVLLMDEPSEGLAPQLVAEVGRTIAQLKAEGQSIVLVEQNIKLTLDLADDVVIINTGAVVFKGEARQAQARRRRSCRSISACSEFSDKDSTEAMADIWNKYEPTAARKRGTPGPRVAAEEHHRRHARPCRGPARGRDRAARISTRPTFRSTISRRPKPRRSWPSRPPTSASASATTDARFETMDDMGVDMQLISPGPPQLYYTDPARRSRSRPRSALNDGIAEYVGKHPDRLVRARRRAAVRTATRRRRSSSAA